MRFVLAGPEWALRPGRIDAPELMDMPDQDPAVLAANLDDLRRVNRWLGGTWLTMRALQRLLDNVPPSSEITLLDVATGGADIPCAVVDWARRQGRHARVVAVDINPAILALAPRASRGAITFVRGDARRLPFADRAFDVAICSLVLHHLVPDDAIGMLREMQRVARYGVIVNDLIRGWTGYLGAWLFSRTLTRNPLTRHDAPLSVRRAYTPAEMAALAARAGLGPVGFAGVPGYRVTMTAGGRS